LQLRGEKKVKKRKLGNGKRKLKRDDLPDSFECPKKNKKAETEGRKVARGRISQVKKGNGRVLTVD